MIFTKDALRSAYFEDLNELGQAYELESRKQRIVINRPFHIGIAVYQLAKLRMLEVYYVGRDRYVDGKDFELIQNTQTATTWLSVRKAWKTSSNQS